MKVSEPLWIQTGDDMYVQVVSYDGGDWQEDKMGLMDAVLKSMYTTADKSLFEEKGSDACFPTMWDCSWGALPDYMREDLSALHVFGENTRLMRRIWRLAEDGSASPVIVAEGEQIAIHVRENEE